SRFHYLVVGTGADEAVIIADAVAAGVSDRVHLLGYVSDETRQLVLDGADFFVQPNIPVADDMEGFGLVVVESAQSGLLTVAADLEGLKDAVRPGVTGFRVRSEDAAAWASTLTDLAERPDRRSLADGFRTAALEIYSLGAMGTELAAHAAKAIGDD
ncbi:MAG: phosphatidyl-myo-inositol dimannoside synthase, partial [Actinomycetota bacterium]|nr:phosphatidyl-myo-inositol dimannoside synthase [Actinomycetota bacterium]